MDEECLYQYSHSKDIHAHFEGSVWR
jgi:hypothetical protein